MVDGAEVGSVSQGQFADFEVMAGQHDVRMTSSPRWFRSPDVRVSARPGQQVELICAANGSAALSFLLFFRPHRYIKLVTAGVK